MKTKRLFIAILAVIMTVSVLFSGCAGGQTGGSSQPASGASELFYENMLDTVGADPDVIYITEGEDAGYYYMYITSDEIDGSGFLAYKSKDLVNWTCSSVALKSGGEYDEATGYTMFTLQNLLLNIRITIPSSLLLIVQNTL